MANLDKLEADARRAKQLEEKQAVRKKAFAQPSPTITEGPTDLKGQLREGYDKFRSQKPLDQAFDIAELAIMFLPGRAVAGGAAKASQLATKGLAKAATPDAAQIGSVIAKGLGDDVARMGPKGTLPAPPPSEWPTLAPRARRPEPSWPVDTRPTNPQPGFARPSAFPTEGPPKMPPPLPKPSLTAQPPGPPGAPRTTVPAPAMNTTGPAAPPPGYQPRPAVPPPAPTGPSAVQPPSLGLPPSAPPPAVLPNLEVGPDVGRIIGQVQGTKPLMTPASPPPGALDPGSELNLLGAIMRDMPGWPNNIDQAELRRRLLILQERGFPVGLNLE